MFYVRTVLAVFILIIDGDCFVKNTNIKTFKVIYKVVFVSSGEFF